MKKNAFTLIELLGVVTILAMLGMVIVPVTTTLIKENKQKLYDTQIRNIKSGASAFVSDNVFKLDIEDKLGITLGQLKDLGYITSDVKNPLTKENFSDDLVIIISKVNNSYEYTVCTSGSYCDLNIDMY